MATHGQIRIETFNDDMFAENAYLVWQDGARDCWIIDPGFPPEPQEIAAAINHNKLSPAAILLTHCHVDHIAGVETLRKQFACPVWCPRDEVELLTSAAANLSIMIGPPIAAQPPERSIPPAERLQLADTSWEARDVCGHSPGALAYYCAAAKIAIVGDAVFADSIGRYDFPHSDRDLLINNIRRNILSLPDDATIYSGHGPPATVAYIRRDNRVLAAELAS